MTSLLPAVLSLLAGFLLAYLVLRRRSGTPERLASGGSVRDDIYRIGFDQAPVGIAHLGTAGQWLQVNRRFAISLGYALDDLMKTTSFHTMVHPEERKNHVAQTRRLIGGEIATFSAIRRIQMKDGRYQTFRVWMSASRRKPDFVECVIGEVDSLPAADVSPASVSEAALPDFLDQLEDVAVVRSNAAGVITHWGRGAERLFGFKAEQAIGKARSILYRDADVWSEKPSNDLRAAISRQIDSEDERVGKDGFVFTTRVTILPHVEGETLKGFAEVFRAPVKAGESEEQKKEREKGRQEIERLSKEAEKLRLVAQRADQLGRANEDLRKEGESLRIDLRKREGIEQSLRDAIQQLRVTDEELMNELKVLTDTLRKEMDRRRAAEQELQEAESELARNSTDWQERLEALTRVQAQDARRSEADSMVSPVASPDQPWRDFEETGPEELLTVMSKSERSGTLFIISGEIEKKVHFTSGKIYSCASNVPSLFLAEILVAAGTITGEQRQRGVDISRESGIALGRILVIMGAVTEAQLVEAMHRKIEEEVAGLLPLVEGRSLFVDGEMPLVQMIPLRVEVSALLEQILTRPSATKPEGLPALDMSEASTPHQLEGLILEHDEPSIPHLSLPAGASEADAEAGDRFGSEAAVGDEMPVPSTTIPPDPGAGLGPTEPVVANSEETDSAETEVPMAPDPSAPVDPLIPSDPAAVLAEPVVGSSSGKARKYHRPGCRNAQRIAPALRISFESAAAAESAGLERCKSCFPK